MSLNDSNVFLEPVKFYYWDCLCNYFWAKRGGFFSS